jgi:predicted DNA-binding protein with PD1-like motif
MKYSKGKIGRVFVIKLEDGDMVPDAIEQFASAHNVKRGLCILIGGIGRGKIVAGPENAGASPVVPMLFPVNGVHEIVAAGTIFPDEKAVPRLHMHGALGRKQKVLAGCVRPGIEVWKIGEVILLEITGISSSRKNDDRTGFSILEP